MRYSCLITIGEYRIIHQTCLIRLRPDAYSLEIFAEKMSDYVPFLIQGAIVPSYLGSSHSYLGIRFASHINLVR